MPASLQKTHSGDFHKTSSAIVQPNQSLIQPVYQIALESAVPEFLAGLEANEKVKRFADAADILTRIRHSHRAIYALRDPMNPFQSAFASIQVAFTQGAGSNIQDILAAKDNVVGMPDTATFYSISIWEEKDTSIRDFNRANSFDDRSKGTGRTLIFGALKDIQEKYPTIKNGVTLSPMPGFRDWVCGLTHKQFEDVGADQILRTNLKAFHQDVLSAADMAELHDNRYAVAQLVSLGALYLTNGMVVRGDEAERFKSHNGVAHFHLGNGARVHKMHPAADASPQGWKNSFGIMTSYDYMTAHNENQALYAQGKPARSVHIHHLVSGGALL